MATSNKNKHRHRRSSSLFQSPQDQPRQVATLLPYQINSSQTLQLIKASEQKNLFQIIVDSFNQAQQIQVNQKVNSDVSDQSFKKINRQAIFNEYFEIQQVHSLKRQDSVTSTLFAEQQLWQDLLSEPRTNGRMRYHRNAKERNFNISCLKMNLVPNGLLSPYDEICCNV